MGFLAIDKEELIKNLLPLKVTVKVRIFRTKRGEIAVTFKELEEKKEG